MSRSIGDHTLAPLGVIAEPVISQHVLEEGDELLVLASDGVWEFIDCQQVRGAPAPLSYLSLSLSLSLSFYLPVCLFLFVHDSFEPSTDARIPTTRSLTFDVFCLQLMISSQ